MGRTLSAYIEHTANARTGLVGPNCQCRLKELIYEMDYHVLRKVWVPRADRIDDLLVMREMRCPGTRVQVLGSRTHERERIQRHDQSGGMFQEEWTFGHLEQCEVKPQHTADHLADIVNLNGIPHLCEDRFQISQR